MIITEINKETNARAFNATGKKFFEISDSFTENNISYEVDCFLNDNDYIEGEFEAWLDKAFDENEEIIYGIHKDNECKYYCTATNKAGETCAVQITNIVVEVDDLMLGIEETSDTYLISVIAEPWKIIRTYNCAKTEGLDKHGKEFIVNFSSLEEAVKYVIEKESKEK